MQACFGQNDYKQSNTLAYQTSKAIDSLGCSAQDAKVQRNEVVGNKIRVDSIDSSGYLYCFFENDSIYTYSKDTILYRINYLDATNGQIRQKVNDFGNGIVSVEYVVNDNQQGQHKESEIYDIKTNKLMARTYRVDTVIVTDGYLSWCFALNVNYYENGNIKDMGYVGHAFGQMCNIGKHKFYDNSGRLNKTENYIFTKEYSYVIVTEFYGSGLLRSEKYYSNYSISDNDTKKAISTWKYYNEFGGLIKTEKHSSFNP